MSKKILHKEIKNVECKYCSKCDAWKPLSCFGKNKASWAGFRSRCKSCRKQEYIDNPEPAKRRSKEQRLRNPTAVKQYSNQYKKNNKGTINANCAKRRAMKLNQTPPNADLKAIQFIYDLCVEWNAEKLNGFSYHVDHIQPLNKGGLDHEDNLQILPKFLNLEKSDKWPLSPEEKIRYKGFRI